MTKKNKQDFYDESDFHIIHANDWKDGDKVVTINLTVMNDNNISLEAKGVYYYLITTTANERKEYLKNLNNQSQDRIDEFYSGIDDLIAAKYAYIKEDEIWLIK